MRIQFILAIAATALLLSACQRSQSTQQSWVSQKCIHKYGIEVQPDYWVDCGRNGQLITTRRDGAVTKQSYANGMLNGESTTTFPHSEQFERVENYCNDELVSQVIYQPSGEPCRSLEYSSPEIWTETVWYESGTPKSVEKFERNLLISGDYYTIQNKRDSWICNGIGERLTRDACGSLVSIDTFRGGQMVQKLMQYPNGTPKEIIAIANGQVHGERKTYYAGGEPMAIEIWCEGRQNGQTTIFQNGEKYAEIPYLAGKKNGIERRFRDGCNVTQEITWFDDQMHGPCYTYVGDSMQTDWFYRGRLSTRSNFESFAIPKKS